MYEKKKDYCTQSLRPIYIWGSQSFGDHTHLTIVTFSHQSVTAFSYQAKLCTESYYVNHLKQGRSDWTGQYGELGCDMNTFLGFILYEWVFWHIYVCVLCVCLVPTEVRRGCQTTGTRVTESLSQWVLGIKHQSSVRTLLWTIKPLCSPTIWSF